MSRWPARRLLHVPLGLLLAAVVGLPTLTGSGSSIGVPAAPLATTAPDPAQAEVVAEAAQVDGGARLDAVTSSDSPGEPPAAASAPSGGPGALQPLRHVVEPGESLASIAQQFGVDVPTLFASNDLDDPDLVPVGTELMVLPVPGIYYRVAEGDTLNRIAERYGLTVPAIMQANDLADSETIQPDQRLVLPGARPLFVGPLSRPAPGRAIPGPAPARLPFLWPAGGPITTYFGEVGPTSPHGHAGLDIAAPWGVPVLAAGGGQVLVATRAGGAYGIQVILDHGDGLRTVYGHLSELDVEADEVVERGQQIGRVGSTGYSTGPHLHFEVRQSGELRDPLHFLP